MAGYCGVCGVGGPSALLVDGVPCKWMWVGVVGVKLSLNQSKPRSTQTSPFRRPQQTHPSNHTASTDRGKGPQNDREQSARVMQQQQSASKASVVSRSRPQQQRHDPSTSKLLHWAPQADAETLARNQSLRQRYREHPEELSPEELERARILVTRDERKQNRRRQQRRSRSEAKTSTTASQEKDTNAAVIAKDVPLSQMEIRRRNIQLRRRYRKYGTKGMSAEDVERAKMLIARDERKRAKRLEYQQRAKEKGVEKR